MTEKVIKPLEINVDFSDLSTQVSSSFFDGHTGDINESSKFDTKAMEELSLQEYDSDAEYIFDEEDMLTAEDRLAELDLHAENISCGGLKRQRGMRYRTFDWLSEMY